ncbi:MAG: IS21 family transposase [Planctomycetes bacterium]|nr:IS21 family transposase [Planctomycetota bacterium]
MANRLKMAKVSAIRCLLERGWSQRRVARELGIDRETVGRYAREGPDGDSKPAIPTAGRKSLCEPYRGIIQEKLEIGLSAQRIWQDLRAEQGFQGSYSSVKRFVRKLCCKKPLPFRRMECSPGEEAQVDFGTGAWVVDPGGRKRHPHVFRIVLSYSRRGYSEAVWRQDSESFLRCLENAFHHFGGVPKTLVIDNLRAGVSRADWYDPELNPKLEEFSGHYGTVILPAKPRMARHKGKIEAGVKFVRGNALKGHTFDSLSAENEHLHRWEANIADHRIHGTTRKQVLKLFEEHERKALLPLPEKRFPVFQEGRRKVHRDGHVEVDRAYYSVPPEYMAREVWVRWDSRLLRIFNDRFEQIAVHCKRDRGAFSTQQTHLASEKISRAERGAADLLRRASLIGPYSRHWTRQMVEMRGVQGVRALLGFLALARDFPTDTIEKAKTALRHKLWRLKSLRRLCRDNPNQEELPFMEEHPVIRGLDSYAHIARFPHVSFRTPEVPEETER